MKNEEILKIEDLVDGGYYKATFKENQKGLIFLLNNKIGENYYHYFISLEDNYFQKDNILTSRPEENIYTKLNQKEIFWLNECIKANKFINYETAMKTFVEEDELYDITNLTPYPENYTDCKKGDKVVLVNYTSKTSKDTKIPLGSVLTINQDNNQIPYVLCKEQIYCVSISQVAPIPDEEQKEEVMKEKTEFKKGDYIVTLISSPDGGPSAIKNYCFKQRCDSKYLKNVLDTKNNTNNGNTGINFSDKSNTKWRYATEEEIKEYDLKGEPYDTSILNKKQYDYEVVHCETQEQWDFVIKKLNYFDTSSWSFKDYPYIILNEEDSCDNKWTGLQDSKIYTFSEWCKLNNYVMEEEKKEWIPKVNDWVIVINSTKIYNTTQLEFIGQIEGYKSNSNYWIKNHNVIKYETYKKICCDDLPFRKALPHEIPNNQNDQEIDIGDEVSTSDGNGIVIGINDSNNYLIKGAKKQHKGSVSSYIKGGPSDEKDSYFYSKDQITLVKKANNNTATRIDTARELGLVFIDTNVPSTKEILKFEIYNQKPSIKKEEFIELNINLTKNIKKPIKL